MAEYRRIITTLMEKTFIGAFFSEWYLRVFEMSTVAAFLARFRRQIQVDKPKVRREFEQREIFIFDFISGRRVVPD